MNVYSGFFSYIHQGLETTQMSQTGEWVNNCWRSIQWNTTQHHETTWMNLKCIMLNGKGQALFIWSLLWKRREEREGRGQAQKSTYYKILFIWHSLYNYKNKKNRSVVARFWGLEKGLAPKGMRELHWGDGTVLYLDCISSLHDCTHL